MRERGSPSSQDWETILKSIQGNLDRMKAMFEDSEKYVPDSTDKKTFMLSKVKQLDRHILDRQTDILSLDD